MYAIIASVSKAGDANDTGLSSPRDSSGGNLVVASVADYALDGGYSFTDSYGNTYSYAAQISDVAPLGRLSLFYCLNPTVGAAHTWGVSGSGSYPALCAAVFSGAAASSVLDQSETFTDASFNFTVQPGPLTPPVDNCLAVFATGGNGFPSTGATVSSDIGLIDEQVPYASGNNFAVSLGHYIQGSAGSINPTITDSIGSGYRIALMATFLPAAAPPSGDKTKFFFAMAA